MKKILVLTALLSAFFVLLPGSAQGVWWGMKCRHHEGPDGSGGAAANVCTSVNISDFEGFKSEAIGNWVNQSNGAQWFFIEFDYIRYWRIGTGGLHEVVEAEETTISINGENYHTYSTDWYNHCNRLDDRTFYSAIRYRLKWVINGETIPPDQWYQLTSGQKFIDGC